MEPKIETQRRHEVGQPGAAQWQKMRGEAKQRSDAAMPVAEAAAAKSVFATALA